MAVVGTAEVVILADDTQFEESLRDGVKPGFEGLAADGETAGEDMAADLRGGAAADIEGLAADMEGGGTNAKERFVKGTKGAGEEAGQGIRDEVKPNLDKLGQDADKAGKDIGSKLGSAVESQGSSLSKILGAFGVPLDGIISKGEGVSKAMSGAGDEAGMFAGAIGSIPVPAVAAAAAVVALTAVAVDLGIKMQAADNQIAAGADISTAAAKKIGDAFLSTAGQVTVSGQSMAEAFAPVSAEIKELAGGTLTAQTSLDFMRASVDLTEASNTSLDNTTKDLATTMRAFGVNANDAAAASDVLYQASRDTGVGLDATTQAFVKLHTQLGANTPPLQDMAGLFTDLALHGEYGRGATAALTTAMKNLVTPTAAAAAAQQQAGIAFTDSTGALLPMPEIIGEVHDKIAGMSGAQATATLTTLGFGQASAKLVELFQAGVPAYQQDVDLMLKHGSAADAASKATSGLGDTWKKTGAALQDFGTQAGETLLPALKDIASAVGTGLTWALKGASEEATLFGDAMRPLVHIIEDIAGPLETAAKDVGHFASSLGDAIGGFLGFSDGAKKASKAASDHSDSLDHLSSSTARAESAQQAMTDQLNKQGAQAGITGDQLLMLTQYSDKSASSVVSDLQKQATVAGTTAEALASMAVNSSNSVDTMAKNVKTAVDSASSSFSSSFDVVSALGTQTSVTADDLSNFYTKSVQQANNWTANVRAAIQDGYDPSVISQLITAGPAKAGTILQGMVANYTPSLVGLVNAGAGALSAAGQQAVQESRLTAMAVQSSSETYANDLSTAMAIYQQQLAQGTTATVQSVAAALNLGVGQVDKVAKEYGESLPNAMTAAAGPSAAAATATAGKTTAALHNGLAPSVKDSTKVGTDAGNAFPLAINLLAPLSNQAGTNIAQKAKEGAASIDPTPTGRDHATKFKTGIDNTQADVSSSGTKMATHARDAAKAVDGSPAGKALVDGFRKGLSAHQGDADHAVWQLAKDAETHTIPLVGGQGVGLAIVQGIEQGIQQGQGGLDAAAAAAAQQAVTSAKAAIQSHSPSRLAAEQVGRPISEGVAVGITENAHLPAAAAASMARGVVTGLATGSAAPTAGSVAAAGGGAGSASSTGVGSSVVIQEGAFQVHVHGAADPGVASAATGAVESGLAALTAALGAGRSPARSL